MASNPQILSDLKVIMEMDQVIELLTVYKGVPFVCKARVADVGENLVHLLVQDPALACLSTGDSARVLGSDYFEPAVAKLASIDIKNGSLDMSDFTYKGTKLGERMIVRVEPATSIAVMIEVEDPSGELSRDGVSYRVCQGELVDVSMSGAGVRLPLSVYHASLKPGTIAHFRMELASWKISLDGTILSALSGPEFYRLSVRFAHDNAQKAMIFKYLIERRAEIEQELRNLYDKVV